MHYFERMKYQLPQPEDVIEKDRENGFGAYIMMFAGTYFPLPFIELISSLIYYLYFRRRSRYAAFHSYQSLMGQIPVTILNAGFFIYAIKLLIDLIRYDMISQQARSSFFPILGVLALLNLIYIIISLYIAIKAKKGIIVYLPVAGKMAYEKFYGDEAVEIEEPTVTTRGNKPPV